MVVSEDEIQGNRLVSGEAQEGVEGQDAGVNAEQCVLAQHFADSDVEGVVCGSIAAGLMGGVSSSEVPAIVNLRLIDLSPLRIQSWPYRHAIRSISVRNDLVD
jgi:hypothetical protein